MTLQDSEICTGRFSTDFIAKATHDAERARWLPASAAQAVVARRTSGDLPPGWDLTPHWAAVEGLARANDASPAPDRARWPPVVPALAFVGSGSVEERASSPIVARASTICRTLRQHSNVLDKSQVLALYEIARRSTIWTRDVPRGDH